MSNDTGLKNIEKMYKNLTYFDQYGGSVIVLVIITLVLLILCSYCYVMINVAPIKKDWQNQRCKPYIIPFAGIINKPDNMSISDFTSQNYAYCQQSILKSVSGIFLQPITFVTDMLNGILNDVKNAINSIRAMFDKLRVFIETVVTEIMGRIMNMMIPLQKIIIGMKDMMGKMQGALTAGLLTTLGAYYTMQSLMGAIAELIIGILIAMAAIMIGLWAVPFTWGAASAMTAVFLAISIPMILVLAFMLKFLKVKPDLSIPKIKCFDKNTLLVMQDGQIKPIIDIHVGDVLENDNKVTAKITVDVTGSDMYNLNDVIVSDSHVVEYNNKWIHVSQHPCALKIDGYVEPYLYCLNTSQKTITINKTVFSDWDELCENDIAYIKKTNAELMSHTSDIHKHLDGGFAGKTHITLNNGSTKEIRNIIVGDILENNEIVYGIVEVDGIDLINQCRYHLGKNVVIDGGPNLNVCDKTKPFTSTLNLDKHYIKVQDIKENVLYHLLTNTKTFYVEKLKFYDYNSTIDLFLEKDRGKLLSMKYV
jgi:hypothetical protein